MANNRTIEILTITLHPGKREEFHRTYIKESLPIQKKWEINVATHGFSQHDENSYYVVRYFKSLEDLQKKEDEFYNSDDWKKGPRSKILGMIDHISTIVIPVDTLREWLEITSK